MTSTLAYWEEKPSSLQLKFSTTQRNTGPWLQAVHVVMKSESDKEATFAAISCSSARFHYGLTKTDLKSVMLVFEKSLIKSKKSILVCKREHTIASFLWIKRNTHPEIMVIFLLLKRHSELQSHHTPPRFSSAVIFSLGFSSALPTFASPGPTLPGCRRWPPLGSRSLYVVTVLT